MVAIVNESTVVTEVRGIESIMLSAIELNKALLFQSMNFNFPYCNTSTPKSAMQSFFN